MSNFKHLYDKMIDYSKTSTLENFFMRKTPRNGSKFSEEK